MATSRAVRSALVDSLTATMGGSVTVERVPPDTVTGATVIVGSIDWQAQTLGGGRVSTIPLWVVVTRKHTSFIDELDRLCDPDESGSVAAAIDSDPTLGAVVDSASIQSAGDYRDLELAGDHHYAATLTLEVFH